MTKRIIIWTAAALAVGLLAVPIPLGTLRDGGTAQFGSLIYNIVVWNRETEGGTYENTRVYFGADRYKSASELWETERLFAPVSFVAEVQYFHNYTVTVAPLEGEPIGRICERVSFDFKELCEIGAEVGDYVMVTYRGEVGTSYPAAVGAVSWEIADLRQVQYRGEWLDKEDLETKGQSTLPSMEIDFSSMEITEIYENCFFAADLTPTPFQYKFNGHLSEDWCVGDLVSIKAENVFCDDEQMRYEGDITDIETYVNDNVSGPIYSEKPVIYLYPEEEMKVDVKLTLDGRLTCTYPAYNGGWSVTASPDGTLTVGDGKKYNYLYWEGETLADYDFSRGFCVRGCDTAAFLEDALEELGLNRREANEFIVYWLPLMEKNEYNVISFQNDAYTDRARLEVTPTPDTVLRVFMAWYASDTFVEMESQVLNSPERRGFCVVEWGGGEVK